jgi:hypothetical protein
VRLFFGIDRTVEERAISDEFDTKLVCLSCALNVAVGCSLVIQLSLSSGCYNMDDLGRTPFAPRSDDDQI